MRRSSRDEGEDNSGYDSFLDIIANLVGILIILVVGIGAQVSSQWSQTQVEEPESRIAGGKLQSQQGGIGQC